MKNLSLPLQIAMITAVIFSSCDKKKDPTLTKEQLLSHAAGWKLTGLTENGDEEFSIQPACADDNIFKFTQTGTTSGGTFSVDEGATKCNSADPQTAESGTWVFNTDKTKITITTDTASFDVTVNTLTTTTLSITRIKTDSGGTDTIVQTFTAI